MSKYLLKLYSLLNPKHGICIFVTTPTEGDTVTVGNMVAEFKKK